VVAGSQAAGSRRGQLGRGNLRPTKPPPLEAALDSFQTFKNQTHRIMSSNRYKSNQEMTLVKTILEHQHKIDLALGELKKIKVNRVQAQQHRRIHQQQDNRNIGGHANPPGVNQGHGVPQNANNVVEVHPPPPPPQLPMFNYSGNPC